jgi:hypothetical protein
MKKLCLAIGLAGVLAIPTAQAAMITLDYGQGLGAARGNFSVAGLGATFDTFCVEGNEYFSPPGTYNAVVNPLGAVNGGVTGGNPDPVSMGTAWLYSQFRAGTLAGYTGAPTVGQLQEAIWFQEGEVNLTAAQVSANQFLQLLNVNYPAWLGYNSAVNANGAWGVEALNVTTLSGGIAQDQLVIVPEPTTMIAGALLLLPFGASAVRILRRKA